MKHPVDYWFKEEESKKLLTLQLGNQMTMNFTVPSKSSSVNFFYVHGTVHPYNTGLFISPSGSSELDCATTNTYTAERIISIGREPLKVFFLY